MAIAASTWVFLASAIALASADFCNTPETGVLAEQRFGLYSDSARLEVLIERMYRTPEHRRDAETSVRRWLGHLADLGAEINIETLEGPLELAGHTIDLAGERFDLHVPSQRPDHGYGLLVYISPERVFDMPGGWGRVLEDRGIILVTPHNASNRDSVLVRRFPLALHALENVANCYDLDPTRIYVGGWSGGSRTAQALALAFPEAFRGALMIAGSFPVANNEPSVTLYGDRLVLFPNQLPADEELLARLRQHSKLVMLTGDSDRAFMRWDVRTLRSLEESGVPVALIRVPRLGHHLPSAGWFARALGELDAPRE